MNRTETGNAKNAILKRHGLTVECFFNGKGKLERKIERYGAKFTEYAYGYDEAGRLTGVWRYGVRVESYHYNRSGQRVNQRREYRGFSDWTGGELYYDADGRLLRAGNTAFYYDQLGALAERVDNQGSTRYFYDRNTMPTKVILPSGTEIRYEYDRAQPVMPARRFRNGTLTTEYKLSGALRLTAYRDYDHGLEYTFRYADSGMLQRVRLSVFEPKERGSGDATGTDWLDSLQAERRGRRLREYLGKTGTLELFCGCDQVGTLRLLTDKNDKLVQEVLRDSFGVQCGGSFSDLFIPLGFAGGLTDPDTGLIRFGWRDYDPSVGRFTAPDPAGDRRGDGDPYDYCLDDPVNRTDPLGLASMPAADSPAQGGDLAPWLRGLSLGTRDVIEGLLGPLDFLAGYSTRPLLNKINASLGGAPDYFQPAGKAAADFLGLAAPRTAGEKVQSAIQQGVVTLPLGYAAGTAMLNTQKITSSTPTMTQAVGRMLSSTPRADAASTVGSATAASLAQQGGAGPLGTTLAGLAGGGLGGSVSPKQTPGGARAAIARPAGREDSGCRGKSSQVGRRNADRSQSVTDCRRKHQVGRHFFQERPGIRHLDGE